ncbi:TPA: Cro/Cl family transcriptional regulator [Acinetobacter baumannii]|uniref:Cro/Cl family transcriptional regulator n=1 Tax=Acinetobacter baumannii TaxID=470 RepID=A0A6I4HUR0_ACIBA|nr:MULTISPECIES: Cro/CI family transcriptional regulator [Acinetobacter]EIL2014836.1 helix-turn-helix domain-containing protein [Acinetobacter baumannii]MBQ4970737.1 helix-turn-helix domain-containing protein [Acinetobacter baumannii]MCF4168904.1 helix-turn-helix domain-containing protein [Acinetobacter baumannii]MCO9048654.1 helix-turn-helix domain-containing protein [Acinetobacter sp. UC24323]MCR4044979.1 helix-turn-helix domain-containing protein [Acinetobacter baumannii]
MSSPKVAFDKAVKIAGGTPTALARGIGLTPWAVHKWDKENIPPKRCEQIEEFTNGEVKAEELRPDINWEYRRRSKKQ